jgi:hypothetical protein
VLSIKSVETEGLEGFGRDVLSLLLKGEEPVARGLTHTASMVDPRDMRESASLLPEAIPPGEPLVLILAALRSPKCWLREAVGRASPTSPCRFSSISVVFWLPEDGVPTLLFFALWLKALIIVLIELSLRTITG